MAVNFLDFQNEEINTILTNHFKTFLEFNNVEQIAFLKANEVETFMHEFKDLCNQSLNLSDKKIEDGRKSTRKKGFFQINANPNYLFYIRSRKILIKWHWLFTSVLEEKKLSCRTIHNIALIKLKVFVLIIKFDGN